MYLEDSASIGVADLVDTRLVHAQRDAVEENDGHADSLEPRVEFSKELKENNFSSLLLKKKLKFKGGGVWLIAPARVGRYIIPVCTGTM